MKNSVLQNDDFVSAGMGMTDIPFEVESSMEVIYRFCMDNGYRVDAFLKRLLSADNQSSLIKEYGRKKGYHKAPKHPVFHLYLKKHRILSGYTQRELNGAISLYLEREKMFSGSVISHWEVGRSLPTKEEFGALAFILQCSEDDLTGGIPLKGHKDM